MLSKTVKYTIPILILIIAGVLFIYLSSSKKDNVIADSKDDDMVESDKKVDYSILIADIAKGIVSEKSGLPAACWGYESTVVVGNKVIMGRGY